MTPAFLPVFLLILLAAPFAGPVAASSDTQARFLAALALLQQGQPDEAAAALQALWTETPTPRIRLELARALMLAGKWTESRALFVEAYKDSPPPAVRANILNLIRHIDRRRGKLELSASVAHYGNPLEQPKSFSINIEGIDLTYEPDREYRNLWGVTFAGSYTKETASGLSFAASASYRELPHTAADRFTGEIYLSETFAHRRLLARQGVIRLDQERQSFTLPYLQFAYTVPVSKKSALRPTVTASYYISDHGGGLSGFQPDMSLPFVHVPNPSTVFSAGPYILWHDAGFAEQRYTSFGLRAAYSRQGKLANVEVAAQGRFTNFHATDPFWQIRRKDRSLYLSMAISSERVRLGPLSPSVGVSCSLTRSTVQYFRQSNCDGFVAINRLF